MSEGKPKHIFAFTVAYLKKTYTYKYSFMQNHNWHALIRPQCHDQADMPWSGRHDGFMADRPGPQNAMPWPGWHALPRLTCTDQADMHCPGWHALPRLTCTAQADMNCPGWHALTRLTCTDQADMHCPGWHALPRHTSPAQADMNYPGWHALPTCLYCGCCWTPLFYRPPLVPQFNKFQSDSITMIYGATACAAALRTARNFCFIFLYFNYYWLFKIEF